MSQSDSNKTPAREFALKYLFHLFLTENSNEFEKFSTGEFYKEDLETSLIEFKQSYITEDDEHPNNQINDKTLFFAHKLIRGVSENMNKIEEIILKETKKSKMTNIEKVERSILLIGVEELLHCETPYQVVINELVNLAKKYGSAESGRYVNGVLDGIRTKTN